MPKVRISIVFWTGFSRVDPPREAQIWGEGGGPPMRGEASLSAKGVAQHTGETPFRGGCVTGNGEFNPPSTRQRYSSREVVLGSIEEP